MKIPPTPAVVGPICTTCHQPVWRENRGTSQYIGNKEPDSGEITVCVWCSAVWKIVDGKCAPLSEREREECDDELKLVLTIFENNRIWAKRLGITLDDYLALCDLIP